MSGEFSWSDLDPADRVVRSIDAVAVYFNPEGDIVIRQQANVYGEEDDVVIVPLDACARLIARLQSMVAEAGAPDGSREAIQKALDQGVKLEDLVAPGRGHPTR